MKKSTASTILTQLEALIADGFTVSVASRMRGFEVTVFDAVGPGHSHFGGVTLAEAMNRAHKATLGGNPS